MALGARQSRILKLILWGALVQMAAALAIGIPMTIAAVRTMAAQLFGVKPYDAGVLLLTGGTLVVASFLAAVIPARRAATLDPTRALHTE